MKKSLLTAGILLLTSVSVMACPCKPQTPDCNCPPPPFPKFEKKCPPNMQRPPRPDFDMKEKLNLTEEQVEKAKNLRIKSDEKIRPLFDELRSKETQRQVVIRSKIVQKDQIKMIDKLDKDIAKIKKQIHKEKIKNKKQFEAILTEEQKQEFQKLKKERRDEFKKHMDKMKKQCPCPPDKKAPQENGKV